MVSNIVHFCILPYVRYTVPSIEFASVRVWRPTEENWNEVFDSADRKLLTCYRDKENRELNPELMTILSVGPTEGEPPSWIEYIAALQFMGYHQTKQHPPAADTFFFEAHSIDLDKLVENDLRFTRFDKLAMNFTSASRDRIFPSRFSTPTQLRPASDRKLFDYLSALLASHETENKRKLRALVFRFRTQFRDPDSWPYEQDIQNWCSAFQTWLDVDDRRDVGRAVAGAIISAFDNARLPRKLTTELQRELHDWFVEFYRVRSMYTHGAPMSGAEVLYRRAHRRHTDIASLVFRLLVKIGYANVPDWLGDNPKDQLEELLLARPTLDHILSIVQKHKIAGVPTSERQQFNNAMARLHRLQDGLAPARQLKGENRVRQVLKSIICAIQGCDPDSFPSKRSAHIRRTQSSIDSVFQEHQDSLGEAYYRKMIKVCESEFGNLGKTELLIEGVFLKRLLSTYAIVAAIYVGENELGPLSQVLELDD